MLRIGLLRALIGAVTIVVLFGCPNGPADGDGSAAETYQGTWVFDDDTVAMEKVVLTISGSSWDIEFFTYPGPTFSTHIVGTVTADGSRFDVQVSQYTDNSVGLVEPGDPLFQDVMDLYAGIGIGYGDGIDSIFYDYTLSDGQLTITLDTYSYPMTRQ
jgi:hypothetical protein